MTTEEIFNSLQEKLNDFEDACSYEWLGIFLVGSQNYKLEYENSDVDARIIYFGHRDDTPRERIYENGEHCEAMTIFTFYDNLMDFNHSQIEVLFTSYYIINPKYREVWEKLIAMREDFVRSNETKWLRSCECLFDIHKLRFENNETEQLDLLERCGYAPKQVYLVVRAEQMLTSYTQGLSYQEVMTKQPRAYLIDIKTGKYSRKEAETIIYASYNRAKAALKKYTPHKTNYKIEYAMFQQFRQLLAVHGRYKI